MPSHLARVRALDVRPALLVRSVTAVTQTVVNLRRVHPCMRHGQGLADRFRDCFRRVRAYEPSIVAGGCARLVGAVSAVAVVVIDFRHRQLSAVVARVLAPAGALRQELHRG
eukprot:CAMPEP_0180143604 /NCGR_PEP_ID=MMETSP0986-20121125/16354_1 /TAXON_ID=697907 /ORGANISM="non described non described, Strain CCMP2293" /LENGTH=111 /DNA_ID=CAMNT_0022087183 /DNA_START=165 /DNA_END=496 /DNA_ORIENTATION=-